MTLNIINDSSFSFTLDNGDVQTFTLVKEIGIWQIKKLGILLEEFTTECSKNGSVLLAALMVAMQKGTAIDLQFITDLIKNVTRVQLGDVAMAGVGEAMNFLLKKDRLELLVAIMYLKGDEKKLSDVALAARIDLFRDEIPPGLVIRGARSFFAPKLKSWKNSLTLLATSWTQLTQRTNDSLNPISENSTQISPSMTDS
jgi:hypothetical protein